MDKGTVYLVGNQGGKERKEKREGKVGLLDGKGGEERKVMKKGAFFAAEEKGFLTGERVNGGNLWVGEKKGGLLAQASRKKKRPCSPTARPRSFHAGERREAPGGENC